MDDGSFALLFCVAVTVLASVVIGVVAGVQALT